MNKIIVLLVAFTLLSCSVKPDSKEQKDNRSYYDRNLESYQVYLINAYQEVVKQLESSYSPPVRHMLDHKVFRSLETAAEECLVELCKERLYDKAISLVQTRYKYYSRGSACLYLANLLKDRKMYAVASIFYGDGYAKSAAATAECYYYLNAYPSAIKLFETLDYLRPEEALYFAKCYEQVNEPAKALAVAEQYKIESKFLDYLINQKKLDEVIAYFEKYPPKDSMSVHLYFLAHHKKNNKEFTEAIFKESIDYYLKEGKTYDSVKNPPANIITLNYLWEYLEEYGYDREAFARKLDLYKYQESSPQPIKPINAVITDITTDKDSGKIVELRIDKGLKHKVKVGCQFVLFRDDMYLAKLRIKEVLKDYSVGSLIPESRARGKDDTVKEIKIGDKACTRFY